MGAAFTSRHAAFNSARLPPRRKQGSDVTGLTPSHGLDAWIRPQPARLADSRKPALEHSAEIARRIAQARGSA